MIAGFLPSTVSSLSFRLVKRPVFFFWKSFFNRKQPKKQDQHSLPAITGVSFTIPTPRKKAASPNQPVAKPFVLLSKLPFISKQYGMVIKPNKGVYIGYGPLPVTVKTRIITFLVGNPYKPSFATATGRGPHPIYINPL